MNTHETTPPLADAEPGPAQLRLGPLHFGLRLARRLFVALVGGTVLVFGVLLIFTPGPAVLVVPIGLGILAAEFVWARRMLEHFRTRARAIGKRMRPNAGDRDEP